jgi:pilus assembly protein CpaB
MSIRTIASLAVALFLGLLAVVLVRTYLSTARTGVVGGSPTAAQGATVPVVIATVAIERGAVLAPGQLKVTAYPAPDAPAGAFKAVAELVGTGPGARVALRAFEVNEPILASRVSTPGGRAGMSFSLTPGMRAISVRSGDVAGVGGFVLPGDRIDVLATRTVGGGESAVTVTQALAQNIRVMAVDQADVTADGKAILAKAVTIEVTPDEAQSISLAQSVGVVTLSLRQVADAAPLGRKATTVADLGAFGARPSGSGAPAARRKPAYPAGTREVKVFRGVDVTGYPVAGF